MNRIFRLLFILLPLVGFSQASEPDYSTVDSLAKTFTYTGDLKLLVSQLTDSYDSDILKARAIFIWITDNIAYDVKAANKNKKPKPFKCRNKKNCDAERRAYEDKYIDDVLSSGKGVCQGYANLFKRMCDYAGLQTDVIGGYIKTSKNMVGKMGRLDHAWNGIIINGKYYYLDATWAAGGCTIDKKGKLDTFVKAFDEYYWLTPEDKFHRNHYPANETPYSSNYKKLKYKNTAYIVSWAQPCAEILEPESGVLSAIMGDTIHFRIDFTCGYDMEKLQVNTNRQRNPTIWEYEEQTIMKESALKKQKYLNFTNENGILSFDYVITDKNTKYIEVLADHKYLLFKFNIDVTEYLVIFGKKVYFNKLRKL